MKINDGVRIDQRLDLVAELQQAVKFLQDPGQLFQSQLGIAVPTQKRTLIGRYRPKRR